jgi:peptidoglycan hydrolase-like protein with peptidoglycan-binding domain
VKRASVTALCFVTLIAGLGGGYAFGSKRATKPAAAKGSVALSTVKVQQRDLVTYDQTTATLGFATSATVSSPIAGTVTSLLSSGEKIEAGTIVATIDGAPVVALYGDTPSYRNLSTAATNGTDVRQLELNLVRLGFDPQHKIVIDSHFDSVTASAVTLFENGLGLKGDGNLVQGEIVFIPGKLLVDTLSTTVGGSIAAGGPLVVGRQTERSFLVSGRSAVTIDHLAAPGTPVVTGTVLFHQNGFPIMAIQGDAAAIPVLTRALSIGVTNGADVKLFKTALGTLGFGKTGANVGALSIDQHYDGATSAAASAWLQSLGVESNPAATTIPIGGFVVVPSGLSVGSVFTKDGSTSTGDDVVLSLTAPARQVTTTAPVGSSTFALGATIGVVFPDGTTHPGKVVTVGNVASSAGNQPGSTPNVRITIRVDDIPKSVDGFVEVPVTLQAIAAEAKDAFVVPVSALIALKEGGYAVEMVTAKNADGSNTTKLVGVKPGLFSDGFVQVDGSLSADVEVVVPS